MNAHIKNQKIQVILENRTARVSVENRIMGRMSIGIQGPPGPPGSSGSALIQRTARDTLGGHRALWLDNSLAAYASSDDASGRAVIGISSGAANSGNLVNIQTHGPIEESSWSWTPGHAIFLGLNGLLTQTPPSSGWLVELGIAESATKIILDIKIPIFRS